jgi:hypothetical protein
MNATQDTAAPGQWTVMKEWSGETGVTQTDKFTTTDRIFRVSWKATELDRGGILDVYVWTGDRRLVTMAAGLQDHVKRSASGQFVVNTDPGVHYLEVRGTGVKWHVAVERPKA